MQYTTKQVLNHLKQAREASGLSQRALAKLAGVPQSHISKIENGSVDLRLSSLIEIARALGLEVTLVPRKTLPAVQSIVRINAPPKMTKTLTDTTKEYQKIINALEKALAVNPMATVLAQIQQQVKDLQRLNVSLPDTGFLRELEKAVLDFNSHAKGPNDLKNYLADIQKLRNSIAHSVPGIERVKPAYSLEDENHD